MIVDSHHHFWDPSQRTYPWMGRALDGIRRPFGPGDLKTAIRGTGVERTILVQTVSSFIETREFLTTAAEDESIAGVIGWVDLTGRAVADTIASLLPGKLVGVRHQVHDEADPEWLLRNDVQRGLAAVADAGLAYDLLVRTRELPAALETAHRHPELRLVIDHAAKPRIASGPRDYEWEEAMASMAELPNVTCKISGLVTEADWSRWNRAGLEPYIRRVVEWFGPERCMFGSDWPVCLLAASYERVLSTVREIVGEDDDVFSGTAIRVYRLTV